MVIVLLIQLSMLQYSIINYSWFFIENSKNIQLYGACPTYQFYSAGIYTIILTIIDSSGKTDTDQIEIEVIDTVPPIANAGGNYSVRVNHPFHLSGNESWDNEKIENFTWIIIINSSEYILYGTTPQFIISEPGTLMVH